MRHVQGPAPVAKLANAAALRAAVRAGLAGSNPARGILTLIEPNRLAFEASQWYYIGMAQQKPEKKKRGPDPERLNIEEDPGEALDRLLGVGEPKPSDDEDEEAKQGGDDSSE